MFSWCKQGCNAMQGMQLQIYCSNNLCPLFGCKGIFFMEAPWWLMSGNLRLFEVYSELRGFISSRGETTEASSVSGWAIFHSKQSPSARESRASSGVFARRRHVTPRRPRRRLVYLPSVPRPFPPPPFRSPALSICRDLELATAVRKRKDYRGPPW